MASFVPNNPCKKIPRPRPSVGIRQHILNRAEESTKRTDIRHYENGVPVLGNTWHKGLFHGRIRSVKAKHAKHQPKYRVHTPSDAQMYNVRHYTVSAGLSRFE